MKKKMIVLAIAGVFAGAGNAFAAADTSANVSGFADARYMITDDSADNLINGDTNPANNAFAAEGEVDFSLTQGAIGARIDLDLSNSPVPGNHSQIEQAFVSWGVADNVNVLVGQMNNPVGQEKQDIVDRDFVTTNVVFNVLDQQTAQYSNNVDGVAVAGTAGMVNYAVAVVNDIGRGRDLSTTGNTSVDTFDANSFAFNVGVMPMEGLNVALGYISQASYDVATNAGSAGNIVDLNADYMWNDLKVGFDYLSASDILDNAYTVWGTYGFGGQFGVGVRYDSAAFDGTAVGITNPDDVTATTFYLAYMPAENMDIKLEIKDGSADLTGGKVNTTMTGIAGINDGALNQIAVTARF